MFGLTNSPAVLLFCLLPHHTTSESIHSFPVPRLFIPPWVYLSFLLSRHRPLYTWSLANLRGYRYDSPLTGMPMPAFIRLLFKYWIDIHCEKDWWQAAFLLLSLCYIKLFSCFISNFNRGARIFYQFLYCCYQCVVESSSFEGFP